MNRNDEQEVIRLFEDGDRALMSADVREMERIYAKDYMQSDETGKLSTRADLIRSFMLKKIRFLSMKSTGRQVRLFGDFGVVHGSEEDEIECDGATTLVGYVYMDVVVQRDGRWQIVASQLVKL